MIDFGLDWAGHFPRDPAPQAIVITHAHPDHAGGLDNTVPCPVYATEATWEALGALPDIDRREVVPRRPFEIDGIRFEAFPVEHSTRAPAVGYRVGAGRVTIFYAPDLIHIHERKEALSGVSVYIGDGATLERPRVRKSSGRLVGHAPVRSQLAWCRKLGVRRMIVTHCGSEIAAGDGRRLGPQLRALAQEYGVWLEIAYDGMQWVLRC